MSTAPYTKICYDPEHKDEFEHNLKRIFSNLYYTWDKDLYEFIDSIDSFDWRKTKSPIHNIHSYIAKNEHLIKDKLPILQRGQKCEIDYLNDLTWFEQKSQTDLGMFKLSSNPILYFSAEYGLVDWLQIYSGGLGVLAGDFIKQVSDHGLPMVAIGLFYHEGYFHQDINFEGMQIESYIPQDPGASLMKLVKDQDGNAVEVQVTIQDHEVYIRAWELTVGRIKLLLLDTDFEKNEKWEDRMITAHLYGGDKDTRIRQEIVLGIGGYRFAEKIGINPSIIHLNEGHASFVLLEKMKQEDESLSVEERFEKAGKNVLFTNHTLNPAGNDKFDYEISKKYLEVYARNLNLSFDQVFSLGTDQLYAGSDLSMTILGLRGSRLSNAVSLLHGKATKKIWPDYPMQAVTNGVHMPTWVAKPVQELIDEHVDLGWRSPTSSPDWQKILDIDSEKLWGVHKVLKHQMIERINSTLGCDLREDILTVIWVRRFASYKRPDIFLNDLSRLNEIVNNSSRPVQFLIGGKAHPHDLIGKELLQKVVQVTRKEEFKNKVVFMTGYNWNLARYVVAGADVWLNNPIRFEEACGTSGMKAGANGVLQLTTLDGWTDEVDWKDTGWVLPQLDIKNEVYNIIQDQIAGLYYSNEIPLGWVDMMKKSMQVCLSHYNMARMLEEYIQLYKRLLN